MGYIKVKGIFSPEMTDIETFCLSKIKGRSRFCLGCGQTIDKGDNCIGRGNNKFCLKCGRKMLIDARDGYIELKNNIEELIKEYDSKIDELNSENMVNKI